jgi:hypothetical protein
MSLVDLDAVEQLGYVFEGEERTALWDAVAELRAARRLIRAESPPHCSLNCPCERNQAWRAYYQAVGS